MCSAHGPTCRVKTQSAPQRISQFSMALRPSWSWMLFEHRAWKPRPEAQWFRGPLRKCQILMVEEEQVIYPKRYSIDVPLSKSSEKSSEFLLVYWMPWCWRYLPRIPRTLATIRRLFFLGICWNWLPPEFRPPARSTTIGTPRIFGVRTSTASRQANIC